MVQSTVAVEVKRDFLKYWYAKDFMVFKYEVFKFDEDNNVISIVGYNDSGKSTALKALAVLLYDAHANDQASFIHDSGEATCFEVGAKFESGVIIRKFKYINGKSLWEMEKDGQMLYTNKTPAGVISAMSGVPEPIAKYLNVAFDDVTREYLNYRDSDSKLLLVKTTGGDNYKMLNAFLRHDVLAESSKRTTQKVNAFNAEIMQMVYSVNTLNGELAGIDYLPEDKFEGFKNTLDRLKLLRLRKSMLGELQDKRNEINNIVIYDELPVIDFGLLEVLGETKHLLETCSAPIYAELLPIDTSLLISLSELKTLASSMVEVPQFELSVIDTSLYEELSSLRGIRDSLSAVMVADELSVLDTSLLEELTSVKDTATQLSTLDSQLSSIDKELEEIKKQLEHLSEEHDYRICDVCGAVNL